MKYVDNTSILECVAGFYNNPTLFEEGFSVNKEDILNSFHRHVYQAVYNLYKSGVTLMNPEVVSNYLKNKPKVYAEFENNKGVVFLNDLSSMGNRSTFKYYYNRMKKFTMFRTYYKFGVDLSWLYDDLNILDVKKKEAQDKWLDETSIDKIADIIDKHVEEIKSAIDDCDDEDDMHDCFEGIRGVVKKFKEQPDIGLSLYGKYFNGINYGARLGKFYLTSAMMGTGKSIPNYTKIPTPSGYRLVGNIQPGDYLFDQKGNPTKVLNIFPQPEKKTIYKVKFFDGRVAECCEDHLWEYYEKGSKGDIKEVKTTKELLEKAKELGGFKCNSGKELSFKIKNCEPVNFSKKNYCIDPYVFGVLLGDGSFRTHSSNKIISLSSENEEIPNKVASIMGWTTQKNSDFNYSYHFKNKNGDLVYVNNLLSGNKELVNLNSHEKYIPKEYLLGSIEQRIDLLNGLLDADGSCGENGRVNFSTTSRELKEDFIELCNSLGICANWTEDRRDKYKSGIAYEIHVKCNREMKEKLFTYSKKRDKLQEYLSLGKKMGDYRFNSIVDIEVTTQKTDMTCFEVDNEDHLFLMNNYIVTHNTRRMIADSCVIGCSSYYNKEKKIWVDCGAPQPTLYTSVEQDLEEIQTMFLCFISGVNENKIRRGGQTPEEAERVNKAINILESGKIKVKTMPEFNIVDIENMVKKSIRQFHITYFFFDYIELNLKIMEEISRKASSLKSMREDNILLIMATKIKDLCRKHNIFFKSSTQVNGEWKTSEHMDQNMISGAKSLGNKIDYGEVMLKVTPADIEKLSPILANGLTPIPKLKVGVYKNRGAEFDDGIIWCNKDLGCCRVDPLFITNYEYQIVEIGQDFFVISEESVDKELCQDEDEKLERAKQDINNFVAQKYSMVEDKVQFKAYWLPKIQNMIETYLGKGKKVNDVGREDLDKLLLLAKDIVTIE